MFRGVYINFVDYILSAAAYSVTAKSEHAYNIIAEEPIIILYYYNTSWATMKYLKCYMLRNVSNGISNRVHDLYKDKQQRYIIILL